VEAFAGIVNRSGGKHRLPQDPVALLRIEPAIHEPDRCPLCRDQVPVQKPGSRQK